MCQGSGAYQVYQSIYVMGLVGNVSGPWGLPGLSVYLWYGIGWRCKDGFVAWRLHAFPSASHVHTRISVSISSQEISGRKAAERVGNSESSTDSRWYHSRPEKAHVIAVLLHQLLMFWPWKARDLRTLPTCSLAKFEDFYLSSSTNIFSMHTCLYPLLVHISYERFGWTWIVICEYSYSYK